MNCFVPYKNKFCPPRPLLPDGTLKPNAVNMSRNMRRAIQIRSKATTSFCSRVGPPGPPGLPGVSGKDGSVGVNGKNGRNGLNGINGKDGRDGRDGRDGTNDMYSFNFITPITPQYNYPITLESQIGYTVTYSFQTTSYLVQGGTTPTVLEIKLIPLGVWLIELTASFSAGTGQIGLSQSVDIDLQKVSTGNSDSNLIRLTTILSNPYDIIWNILAVSTVTCNFGNLNLTISRIA